MEIKILNKTENALFNLTEITAEVAHEGAATPKRADVRKLLAAQLGAEENRLALRQIDTPFSTKSKIIAVLYKTKEDLQRAEPKYIVGRDTGAKKKRVGKAKK